MGLSGWSGEILDAPSAPLWSNSANWPLSSNGFNGLGAPRLTKRWVWPRQSPLRLWTRGPPLSRVTEHDVLRGEDCGQTHS
jgi:hypothetical protein